MQSHDFYTTQIVIWTKKNFNFPGLDIADDTQDTIAGCRPNQVSAIIDGDIRSCLPDFSARNIIHEPNLFILGEAKTADDFLTRHEDAENQMNVMINFLKKQPKPILVYSIPNEFVKRVQNELQKKITYFNAANVQVEVIDQYFK